MFLSSPKTIQLTDKEIDEISGKIISSVKTATGGTIRQ